MPFKNKRIESFNNKLASSFCSGLKDKDEVSRDAERFIDRFGEYIIDNAGSSLAENEKSAILEEIKNTDPLIAAELLLAIRRTGNIEDLTSVKFLDSIRGLDTLVASSLIYEIQITGNVAALTDERLFADGATTFFNALGYEAASEWFYSIAKTGNVEDLTSEKILTSEVLAAIREDSKISSELSFAIGETGKVDAFIDHKFLEGLKGLDSIVAAEYLSAIWCTNGNDELIKPDVIYRLGGDIDLVWKEAIKIARGGDSDSTMKIMISNPGEGHDRGAKLLMRDLISRGFDVVYAGPIQDYREIVQIAQREKVNAIGFGLAGNSHRSLVTDTLREMRINGFDDVVMFSGGFVNNSTARKFEQKGIKVFTPETTPNVISFLNNMLSPENPTVSAQGEGKLNGFTYRCNYSASYYAISTDFSSAVRSFTGGTALAVQSATFDPYKYQLTNIPSQNAYSSFDIPTGDYRISQNTLVQLYVPGYTAEDCCTEYAYVMATKTGETSNVLELNYTDPKSMAMLKIRLRTSADSVPISTVLGPVRSHGQATDARVCLSNDKNPLQLEYVPFIFSKSKNESVSYVLTSGYGIVQHSCKSAQVNYEYSHKIKPNETDRNRGYSDSGVRALDFNTSVPQNRMFGVQIPSSTAVKSDNHPFMGSDFKKPLPFFGLQFHAAQDAWLSDKAIDKPADGSLLNLPSVSHAINHPKWNLIQANVLTSRRADRETAVLDNDFSSGYDLHIADLEKDKKYCFIDSQWRVKPNFGTGSFDVLGESQQPIRSSRKPDGLIMISIAHNQQPSAAARDSATLPAMPRAGSTSRFGIYKAQKLALGRTESHSPRKRIWPALSLLIRN